jgi:predicted RNA-binding Zn ribbon-like protein
VGYESRSTGPAEFATWLHVAGLPAVIGPVDLDGVRKLREALHAMTRARVAGRKLSRADVALVNAAALAGPPPSLLSPDGESLRPPAAAPLAAVLSIVARDAVELFGGRYGHRIRACLGHDCSLYFVDRSRPGSRRWCAMAACGEKASSATYRQRHASRP